MIPSSSPRPREPIVNLPGIVTAFILVLAAVHLWRNWFLTEQDDALLLFDYALIPARWSIAFLADGISSVVHAIRAGGAEDVRWQLAYAQALVQDGSSRPWTAITHVFLHGSWVHLAFNVIWLAAFGAPLARRWGGMLFAVFCLATAISGAVAHYFGQPYSVVPTIGASGIVSGMFGAASWYVFGGRSDGMFDGDLSARARLSFPELVRNPTVLTFIVFWFIGNSAVAALPEAFVGEHTEIAWQAHVGGFLGGFVLFPLIDDHRRKSENQ